MSKQENEKLFNCTTKIVSAYLKKNKIKEEKVLDFFELVYFKLKKLSIQQTETEHKTSPAVPIEDSIKNDSIICLEDGKEFKMLKRHLATNYNMTPEQYRQKWNLPFDYPMVAPEYSKTRKLLAKKSGLGKSR